MTAEIAIMNGTAIALAADSAVTIQLVSNAQVKEKTYNTTNKLFMLSKLHPVGVMLYGNATILHVPWEVVIKEYRSSLGSLCFDSVRDYAHHFIAFLGEYFPENDQVRHLLSSVRSFLNYRVLPQIDEAVHKAIHEEGQVAKTDIRQIVRSVIRRTHRDLKQSESLSNVADDFEQAFVARYEDTLDRAIDAVLEKLPLSKKDRQLLHEIGAFLFSKNVFPDSLSGIVIAGFGNTERYPALYAFDVDGVVGNRLKYRITHDHQVNTKSTAYVIPFAQQEMVYTFIEGIDPEYDDLIRGYLNEMFEQYPRVLMESLNKVLIDANPELLRVLQENGREMLKHFVQRTEEYRQTRLVSPIISMVALLPKDELAAMAESLVNLTSFKRRVSMETETVGGPIDVAVISKGDGFIWIKRKHYFDSQLNHHFFANYYRELEGGRP